MSKTSTRRQNRGGTLLREKPEREPADCLGGVRHGGGVSVVQALVRNVGTCCPMPREKSKWRTHQDESTEAGRGTEQPVGAMKSAQNGWSEGVASSSLADGSTLGEEPVSPAKSCAISKLLVGEAYKRVKAHQGAAGVDAESVEQFERKLEDNLYKIWNRMSSGTYFPPPVRTVAIPKKAGGERKLGIPTVADRIAQTVVAMYLEPLVEPQFHPDS